MHLVDIQQIVSDLIQNRYYIQETLKEKKKKKEHMEKNMNCQIHANLT